MTTPSAPKYLHRLNHVSEVPHGLDTSVDFVLALNATTTLQYWILSQGGTNSFAYLRQQVLEDCPVIEQDRTTETDYGLRDWLHSAHSAGSSGTDYLVEVVFLAPNGQVLLRCLADLRYRHPSGNCEFTLRLPVDPALPSAQSA